MKLILHVGPHKTGTTWIQKQMLNQVGEKNHASLVYPEKEITIGYGHHGISDAARKSNNTHALRNIFSQVLFDDGRVNVISSENFDYLDLAKAKKLALALEGVDTEIVFYYRPFFEVLPSAWQEGVKHGLVSSFHYYTMIHLAKPFKHRLTNPNIVVDIYKEAFGFDKIHIADYRREVSSRGLLGPILEVANAKVEEVSEEVVNRSLTPEDAEILRAININFKSDNVRGGLAAYKAYMAVKNSEGVGREIINNIFEEMQDQKCEFDWNSNFITNKIVNELEGKYKKRIIGGELTRFSKSSVFSFHDSWMIKEFNYSLIKELSFVIQKTMSGVFE